MLTAIVIAAILSIQLGSVHLGTVEKCLEADGLHKKFPSREENGFAACFPWQSKSCCSPETTVRLKENGAKEISHFDWEYCGALSEPCEKFIMSLGCFYLCEPNLFKWQISGRYVRRVPICSDTCDRWFEACKNDKTYSDNWFDDYVLYRSQKGEIKPNKPCRTFAEIFKNGKGICNKLSGLSYKYEKSSNCMVFDFKGENPNDKVVPGPSSSS